MAELASGELPTIRIGEEVIEGSWGGADPFAANFRDDPYAVLNPLRENDPVNFTPVGTWRISRFADIEEVLRSARTSMTLSDGSSPNFDPLDRRGSFLDFMLNKDGEDHFRLRKLAMKALTAKTVKAMEVSVIETAEAAVDQALREGGMEVIDCLARRVPSIMICRIMGVPDTDREKFIGWTAARTNAFFGRFLPPEVQAFCRNAGEEMADYFDDLVAKRRADPQEDLISQFIAADVDGQKLTDAEIVVQAIGLITAGFETTIGLIGNGVRGLVEHPDQLERLRANEDLTEGAVREALRFDPPVLFNWRVLEEPYELSGRLLPKDAVLWLMLGSANRDPRRFERPDVFDIERKDGGHASFGGGPHVCLGNNLARMEARHAFRILADRTKGLKITSEPVVWSPSFFRVMDEYRIAFS